MAFPNIVSNRTVITTNMTPGAINDCDVRGCTGVVGGVCVHLASYPAWRWCCLPGAVSCWRPEIKCGQYFRTSELAGQLLYCSTRPSAWCCLREYDACPGPEMWNRCAPSGFANPAIEGPIWAAEPNESPTPTRTVVWAATNTGIPVLPTPEKELPSPIIGGAAVALVGAVGGLVYYGVRRFKRARARAAEAKDAAAAVAPVASVSSV